MNLDMCTPNQKQSIMHIDGPLLVSAGAGSGKTFMLTQRIAYALMPESGPAIDGIDEVLAITFTEKAAAEIKARVKRTLRAEGLYQEALKVDDAWISTIHGMCSRILKTHAFDLGIDPSFTILGDVDRSNLIQRSIDEALREQEEATSNRAFASLFDEYPVKTVIDMLNMLFDKTAGIRGGLDAVDFGPKPATASAIARNLLLSYEEIAVALEQGGESSSAQNARVKVAEAIEALGVFLNTWGKVSVQSPEESNESLKALARFFGENPRIGANFGSKLLKSQIKEHQEAYVYAAHSTALALAYPYADLLLCLARRVKAYYEQIKTEKGVLDNDDLLTRTLDTFETHPAIAQRYEQRFKLVMVDEFQDTSQLQIDMISLLAGENCAHLCTVGDSQQSIYRFRGADVNVYEKHKFTMQTSGVGALYVELAKNFRSHSDILSFVDCVFAQPQVFGDKFMSLIPNEKRKSHYQGKAARIDMVLSMLPTGQNTGVTVDDAKRTSAREIARRFAALRADGHAAGDMVLLLGRMTRAHVYAEALREEGFECVVAGGSQFAQAAEVHLVERLLQVIANPKNTAALFEVLTSDMLRLSSAEMLILTTEKTPDGSLRRCPVNQGLFDLENSSESMSPRLANAIQVITRAIQESLTQTASIVVRNAIVRSGWMARLEANGAAGTACAANILKAIRIIERLEADRHVGIASAAHEFSAELSAMNKEAPGALSGKAGDVVKIMTIHASKGLEFPIVALADFADKDHRFDSLVAESCGSVVRASLDLKKSKDLFSLDSKNRSVAAAADKLNPSADLTAACKLIKEDSGTCSQVAYLAALKQYAADENFAESRRKLYVGLTRASEALIVAMDGKEPSSGKPASYLALVDDIRSALCGEADFPTETTELSFGGTAPARFERVLVHSGDDTNTSSVGETSFLIPIPDNSRHQRYTQKTYGSEVFSYSSIASALPAVLPATSDSQQDSLSAQKQTEEYESSFVVEDALQGDKPFSFMSIPKVKKELSCATNLGSAFHRAAQYAVETGSIPESSQLCVFSQQYGLSVEQKRRLDDACRRWFTSSLYSEVVLWPYRRAEVPFFKHIGNGFIEGEIDLLCSDGLERQHAGHALVIDYKTGGFADELPEDLKDKHALQARCYAYALLEEGFVEVELRFVRVEQEDRAGDPQVVSYEFSLNDKDALRAYILELRSKCNR